MKLAYSLKGSPSSPWLVFFHGFLGSQNSWSLVVESFPSYCCCLIDLPGHGESRAVRLTFKEAADSVSDILESYHISSAIFIGYSMGGRFSIYFSSIYPQKVKRLILESTSLGIEDDKERKRRLKLDQNHVIYLINNGLKKFLSYWYAQPLFKSLHNYEWFLEYLESCESNDEEGIVWSLNEWSVGRQPSFWNYNFKVIGDLIVGGRDIKYVEIASKVVLKEPHFSLHIIPTSGHNTHLETRAQFASIIKKITEVSYDLE